MKTQIQRILRNTGIPVIFDEWDGDFLRLGGLTTEDEIAQLERGKHVLIIEPADGTRRMILKEEWNS
jgi:hypothetical protein